MTNHRYFACVLSNEFPEEHRVRREISETLASMQVVTTGYSFPRLADGYLWKLQQLAMDDADFCILVVGSEYGALSPTGVGFLHRAFAHARTKKKPILVLDLAFVQPCKDPVDARRRDGLVKEISNCLDVSTVQSLDDMRHIVESYFDQLLEQGIMAGWVSAGQASNTPSPRLLELESLVASMRDELSRQRKRAGHDESFKLPPVVDFNVKVFRDGNVTPFNHKADLSWQEIFNLAAPLVTSPQRESDWKNRLEDRLLQHVLPMLKKSHPKAHSFIELKIAPLVFDEIKLYFRRRNWVLQHDGVWVLSPLGEHLLLS